MNSLSLISVLCFAAVLVEASASGYYVPKGYYVIHSDGHQSPLSKISPEHQQLLLHRVRRSPQYAAGSSSSSNVVSNGSPVYFQQATSSQVSPGGINPQSYYPGYTGSNNDDDEYYDEYYDDATYNNNNQPSYQSSRTQTGNYAVQRNLHTRSASAQHTHVSSHSRPTAYGYQTQSTGILYPYGSSPGNILHTQYNSNGVHTQTSGVIYPNGQVQITSQNTGRF